MPFIPIIVALIAVGGSVAGAVKADKERKALEAMAAAQRQQQQLLQQQQQQEATSGLPGWFLPAAVVGGIVYLARR